MIIHIIILIFLACNICKLHRILERKLEREDEGDHSSDVNFISADFYNLELFKDAPQDALLTARVAIEKSPKKFNTENGTWEFRNNKIRPGKPSEVHRCDEITAVPENLMFILRYNYYKKYTHAYGIPVVSSMHVSEIALKRACYVVRFLLADREDIRHYLYRNFGRVGVIGAREDATSIPEHNFLDKWWNKRARGLGGILPIPISTASEENLLCWKTDIYWPLDLLVHEFAHMIQEVAIRSGAIPGFLGKLQIAYEHANSSDYWQETYALTRMQEYFAQGVESYFATSKYPNGHENLSSEAQINTRHKLEKRDPLLYYLIKEIFPCENIYHQRCDKDSPPPLFKMNCNIQDTSDIRMTSSEITDSDILEWHIVT